MTARCVDVTKKEAIIKTPTDDVIYLKKLLGKGGYGCTYKAQIIVSPKNTTKVIPNIIALKMIDLEDALSGAMTMKTVNEELNNMKLVSNITSSKVGCNQYIGCYYDHFIEPFQGRQKLFVEMELIDGISFQDYIHSSPTDFKKMWKYTVQILEAVEYIHSKGIAHQDIKPDNIMIDTKSDMIKLIDFGLSCYDKNVQNKELCLNASGTPLYVPPEVYLWRDSNKQRNFYLRRMHDVWSTGIVLYLLWNNDFLPFSGKDIDELIVNLSFNRYIPSKNSYAPINEIIDGMLRYSVKVPKSDMNFRGIKEAMIMGDPPFRWSIKDALDYIDTVTKPCMIHGMNISRDEIIKLLKSFNVTYDMSWPREKLCASLKNVLETCTINKKSLTREQMNMLAKLFGISPSGTTMELCSNLKNRLTTTQEALKQKTTRTIAKGIQEAAKKKTIGDSKSSTKLLDEISDVVKLLLKIKPDLLDKKYFQGRFKELSALHKNAVDKRYKQLYLNEAGFISALLKVMK